MASCNESDWISSAYLAHLSVDGSDIYLERTVQGEVYENFRDYKFKEILWSK